MPYLLFLQTERIYWIDIVHIIKKESNLNMFGATEIYFGTKVNMRLFYRCFPIRDTLRHELTWSHYRQLYCKRVIPISPNKKAA